MKVKTKKRGIVNRKTTGFRIDTTVAEAAAIAATAVVCAGYTAVSFGRGIVRFITNKPDSCCRVEFPDPEEYCNDDTVDI